jgi:hypothetical protein
MINWNDEMVQEERRQQQVARAERYRLLDNLKNPAPRLPRTYHILFARLGDLLYSWGCQLRTRYGALSQPVPELPYRGFGGFDLKAASAENRLVADTGNNSTPCSG